MTTPTAKKRSKKVPARRGHTPGNWELEGDYDNMTIYVRGEVGRFEIVPNVGGEVHEDEEGEYTDYREVEANANLLLAAPALLRVLQRLVAPFEGAKAAGMDLPQAVIEHDSQILKDIRAAIAKATGAA